MIGRMRISKSLLESRKAVNKEEMLRNARNHCFFVGLNDSGAALCKANTVYGIAGIHYVQNQPKFRVKAGLMVIDLLVKNFFLIAWRY